MPLPLGSYPVSGWAVSVVGINVLILIWLVLWVLGHVQVTVAFQQAWLMLLLFSLWLLWIAFQVMPLPMQWLEAISPEAARLHTQASLIIEGRVSETATISLDTHATTSRLIQSIAYTGLFCLALLLVDSRQRLRMLAWTLVISGAFQAFYGALMMLSGVEQIFWYEKERYLGLVTGTFRTRTHAAGYLVICLSVGVGLMLALLDRRANVHWKAWLRGWMVAFLGSKFRLRLFLIIMVTGLVMTQSRAGNVSFIVSLLITSILGMVFLHHARRGLAVLLTSILVIDIVIIGAWFGLDKVMDRLEKTVVETGGQTYDNQFLDKEAGYQARETDIALGGSYAALLHQRGLVYQDMKVYMRDYWLTGSGLGTFHHLYSGYRGPGIRGYTRHAHNDYYEFFAETGLPGIMFAGAALLLSLAVALITMIRRKDQLANSLAFAVVMSISALLMHATVDFTMQIPAYAMTFMVILALSFIVKTLPTRRRESRI